MTEQIKVKGSALRRGVTAVIVLAVVFALLIVGYFAILRPYLNKNQAEDTTPVEMIWSQEVEAIENRVLMYEHITRDQISKIDIHNPENAKFGEQYVDWGFYRYGGETDEESGLINGEFYLIDYEYAPFDETAFANLITAAGYTLATSRVEDHCSDFSKYGLDYASAEEALSVTLTATDGRVYTYYIGDKNPSGTGYYVRCVNNDKLLSSGEEMQRDSVYLLPTTNLSASVLLPPQRMIDPYLTLPVDTSTVKTFDQFAIWRNEEKYFSPTLDEEGNQKYDEDGNPVAPTWSPMIYLRPVSNKKDPFTLFAGNSIYYAVTPNGYYGSTTFENMISLFAEFKADEVVELGQTLVNDKGEEYIGFTDETLEKYGLRDQEYHYRLFYEYAGIQNYVYFSKKQADGSYYALSLHFNIIAKVTEETVHFLNWTPETYIQRQVVNLSIGDCSSIALEGSYFDLGESNPDRKGEVTVNEIFKLSDNGVDLVITDADGKTVDTDNFRELFVIMLRGSIRDEVSAEDIAEAMKNEPMAKLTIKTVEKTVYKKDDAGETTTRVDYVLQSVSKIYRYYKLTNGRVLCTIENIDADGNSLGESGKFYMLTARVEELLSAAVDLKEGIAIEPTQRK